ncbi:MAG TPA: hypothetical protein VME66_01780, partial [Candidatus Acidoferrales bacterium]|nr:hypothetical protein [Candidatus Acidoferrales bacterium]
TPSTVSAVAVPESAGHHHGRRLPASEVRATPTPADASSPPASTTPAVPGIFGALFGGGSATPLASPSGGPAVAPSGLPADADAPPGGLTGTLPPATPTPKPTPPPLVNLTIIPYPKYAPDAPGPAPSASSPPLRHAIIRAEFSCQGPLTLSSLDSLLFTVPAEELFPGRGFSVLLLEEAKHKRDTVLYGDTGAQLDATTNTIHTTGAVGPMVLLGNHHYAAVLYGDDPASTPAPVPTTRFGASPTPSGAPGVPGAPGIGATAAATSSPGLVPTPIPPPANPGPNSGD